MLPIDLIHHAARLIIRSAADEADRRRAVSASYYALFNAMTGSAAELFGVGFSPVMQSRIARSLKHQTMRKVCEAFKSPTSQSFRKTYEPLMPPNPDTRLFGIAATFCRLQEARHSADYDMLAVIDQNDAYLNVQAALKAVVDWQAVTVSAEARVFITLLFIADRQT